MAQIPNESPIPVDFRIESQDGLVRTFDYTSAVAWCDTLTQTVSGDLVWAYGLDSLGNETDSLLCDSMAMGDLTGKIALIRRGLCNFSLKAYRAKQAGAIGVIIVNGLYLPDGGGLVNMAAGLYAANVEIPTIFISREDGDIILDKLDNGTPVTAFFEVRGFSNPRAAYSYHTPLAGVKPLEDVSATYINISSTMTLPSVTINAEFTDPSGATSTLSQTITDVAPLSINKVDFDETYTPSMVGEYNVLFTNSFNADELESSFIITEHTFALDDNNLVPNTNGTLELDSASFVNAGFRFDMGNFYRTGPTPVKATHITFVLGNHSELYTGTPSSDVMYINIYNADPDNNGSVPYPGPLTSYNGFNEGGTGQLNPIAFTEYVIQESDQDFQFTTVELPSPVTLEANKIYLVNIQYNGLEAGSGIPPKFAFGGDTRPAGELGSMIFDDSLRTDGFGVNYFMRLHLEGFATSTNNPLEDHKVTLSPNPASKNVNLELALDQVATEVDVRIYDFTGRLVSTRVLDNVQKGRFAFDVSKMNNGTYFMAINTPEGFRSKKFQVMH
ncbi:MAG: T9SS type A sorting domain-containing protein [Saprospiraceae bacterium]|nr:T9SS type A sorting domain-containing protein [Saprospiraceae bacterium]